MDPVVKALSPVLDYAADLSVATFVYDRWFLKTCTGAGNATGMTLHRALAEKSLGNAWLRRLKSCNANTVMLTTSAFCRRTKLSLRCPTRSWRACALRAVILARSVW